jgi:hypothetical protein
MSMAKKDRKFWADIEQMEAERVAANLMPLVRCPFCGAEAGEDGVEVTGTHPGTDWVECNACGCQGPRQTNYRKFKGAAARAVNAWNDRGRGPRND